MDEAGHIPGQAWSGFAQIALDGATPWNEYVVGGIPSPSAQLLHFQLTPESATIGPGFLTLFLASQTPHGIQAPNGQFVYPVKVFNILPSTTGNNPQVYEYNPAIPMAFDTALNTFSLLNGDPYGLAPKASGQFAVLISIIPFH